MKLLHIPMETLDANMLTLLKSEDNEIAFRQLYDRHWKRLYLLSLRLLDDESDAKDVVQDVFLALWSKRKSLEIKNLNSYLLAAAKYKCLEHLKNRKNNTTFLERVNFFIHENNIEKKLDFQETKTLLENRLDVLPAKTKQIFRMSRYEELSNKEIAHELNISIKTVEYHITQSIKQLRGALVS